MKLHYCEGWFLDNKCAVGMRTEVEAQKAHADGTLYTAIVGNPKRPFCYLEITAFRVIHVFFMDSFVRPYMNYQYTEERPGQLFLTMAATRSFDGETETVTDARLHYFAIDGRMAIDEHDRIAHTVRTLESTTDISNHWEPYPEFGEFEGLARAERNVLTSDGRYRCLCCGYKTLPKRPPGTFQICPVCRWTDDLMFKHPSDPSVANPISLVDARENYRKYRICIPRPDLQGRIPLPKEL